MVFTPVQWDKFEGVRCVPTTLWYTGTNFTSGYQSPYIFTFRVSQVAQNEPVYFLCNLITCPPLNSHYWMTSIDRRTSTSLTMTDITYTVSTSDYGLQLSFQYDSVTQNGCITCGRSHSFIPPPVSPFSDHF